MKLKQKAVYSRRRTKRRRQSRFIEEKRSIHGGKWHEMSLPEAIDHLTKLDSSKSQTTHGAGNFYNPKSAQECYDPLTGHTFQFWNNITIPQLKLVLEKAIDSGSFNAIHPATGTQECRDPRKRIILRKSHTPFKLSSSADRMELANYEKEMHLFTSLHGITPNLYMCGLLNESMEGYVSPFAIMDRMDMSVESAIIKYGTQDCYTIISKMMNLYNALGSMGVCNVDVKPKNAVCSRLGANQWDVKLIDIDPNFNLSLSAKEYGETNIGTLYAMIMKYLFLQHIIVYTRGQSLHSIAREMLQKELIQHPLYLLFLGVMVDQINANTLLYKNAIKWYKLPFNTSVAMKLLQQGEYEKPLITTERIKPQPPTDVPGIPPVPQDPPGRPKWLGRIKALIPPGFRRTQKNGQYNPNILNRPILKAVRV